MHSSEHEAQMHILNYGAALHDGRHLLAKRVQMIEQGSSTVTAAATVARTEVAVQHGKGESWCDDAGLTHCIVRDAQTCVVFRPQHAALTHKPLCAVTRCPQHQHQLASACSTLHNSRPTHAHTCPQLWLTVSGCMRLRSSAEVTCSTAHAAGANIPEPHPSHTAITQPSHSRHARAHAGEEA